MSTERTYAVDIPDNAACAEELMRLFEDPAAAHRGADCAAEVKSRTLKLRFDDFSTTTISRAGQTVEIECFRELLDEAWQRKGLPIRLLGIGVQLRGRSP